MWDLPGAAAAVTQLVTQKDVLSPTECLMNLKLAATELLLPKVRGGWSVAREQGGGGDSPAGTGRAKRHLVTSPTVEPVISRM